MHIFGINFTPNEIISMIITLIILFGIVIWAQSFKRKTYNIIGNRGWFFLLSAILLVVSVYSLSTKHLNWGLDFTGGTIIQLGFENSPSTDTMHKELAKYNPNFSDATIQIANRTEEKDAQNNMKTYQKVLISVRGEIAAPQTDPKAKLSSSREVENIVNFLKNKYGNILVYKVEHIGPVIGKELKQKALVALLIALFIQLIYITFRFGTQLRYGLAADIALVHDLFIMVGLYSLFGKQADSPFLAALLTVVGYSVMDSIVIFDRIRENLKLFKSEKFETIVNISVNQTMTRSINTLLTVLLTLFALYFFGGETLKNFAFALLIGVTLGAYSSVFVASPLLVIFDNFLKSNEQKKMAERRAKLEKEAIEKKQKKSK